MPDPISADRCCERKVDISLLCSRSCARMSVITLGLCFPTCTFMLDVSSLSGSTQVLDGSFRLRLRTSVCVISLFLLAALSLSMPWSPTLQVTRIAG